MSRVLRSTATSAALAGAQAAALLIFASFALSACTNRPSAKPDTRAAAMNSPGREVNLAIWANYLSPEIQAEFTKDTGVKINMSNFSSNEELLAKIQAGASGIDVAVPSDYMVDILIKTQALERLDKTKIPNKADLDPMVLAKAYDPENLYSLPFAWSTTGISVNRDLYKGKITGWKDLFNNKDLAGKVSLLDDVREVTAAALKLNGNSVNSTSPEELDRAKASLLQLRPRVKMFRSDTADLLVNGEVVAAQTYSSDAFLAKSRTKANIEYILPVEGGTWAIDNLVILKGSPHAAEALELINFLLSHDANVAFVTKNFGGPVLKSTRASLPPELRDQKGLFPPPDVLQKLELLKDLGEGNKIYDRLWTEVKAQ